MRQIEKSIEELFLKFSKIWNGNRYFKNEGSDELKKLNQKGERV
jgi:hypothetical protein